MRLGRTTSAALGLAMLCLSGCFTWPNLMTKKHQPEEYVLPPADDPRFSEKIQYPKGTLNQDMLKPPDANSGNPFGSTRSLAGGAAPQTPSDRLAR